MLYNEKWEKDLVVQPVAPWRQHLLGAAKVLREHGHVKGFLEKEGKFCALGAISKAVTGTPYNAMRAHEAVERLTAYLTDGACQYDYGETIVRWNNADERTAEEVIAALEACARM